MERKVNEIDQRTGEITTQVSRVDRKCSKLEKKVDQVEANVGQVQATVTQVDTKVGQVETKVGQVETKVGQVEAKVARVETDVARVSSELKAIRDETTSEAAAPPTSATAKSPPPVSPPRTSEKSPHARGDSLIVREYPPLFEEFRMKRWVLLWRGSRDGFTARGFHRRCDGHANTVTLILDTVGNVFGGFTPVEWESRKWNGKHGNENNSSKGDDSMRSFLFTQRTPHGVPPRKFALREETKGLAIICDSTLCAVFSGAICVCDNCNTNSKSYTWIGSHWEGDRVYENDTRFEYFFTGAEKFTVKEIEVFEITH
jgi:outer membrane murein-binding lipoprotein Lpp